MTELEVGQQVGNYRILRRLGEGGAAVVYLAKHILLGSMHAIKVLSMELLGDQRQRARFHTEGEIQARISHPNIVPVTDLISEPGIAALVMAYIEGPTLESWMRNRGALSLDEALRLTFEILEGMSAAHEQGIVHRDLKPSNVLLALQKDGTVEVRISDFGIAKQTAGDPRLKTKTGALLGTVQYMSPEQTRGLADVDAPTDVWAVGAMLYEMLAGRPAFADSDQFETMKRIVSGARHDLRPIRRDVPEPVHRVIDSALAVERAGRYANCRAMSQALRKALVPAPPVQTVPPPFTPARPADEPERLAKPAGAPGRSTRHSTQLATLGLLATVIAALGVIAISRPRQAPPPPLPPPPVTTEPPPPPPPINWWSLLHGSQCAAPCAAGAACAAANSARCPSGITCLPGKQSDLFSADERLELHLSYVVEIGSKAEPCQTSNDYWVCRQGTDACLSQLEACRMRNQDGVAGAKSSNSIAATGDELDHHKIKLEIRDGGPQGPVVQTVGALGSMSRGVLCKGYGLYLKKADDNAVVETIVFYVDHG